MYAKHSLFGVQSESLAKTSNALISRKDESKCRGSIYALSMFISCTRSFL